VEFGASIEADLSRRDFTMNAAAYGLPSGPLVDPFDGQKDIKRRLIRCVGRPEERFSEDGLRPVRALRFASQLNFIVDAELLAAIPGAINLTAKVATERLRDELDKIIASPKPSAAFLLMEQTGMLSLFIPELTACRGIEQDRIRGFGFHRFDVLDHSLLACDYAARKESPPEVRLAALYHDIGKPLTHHVDETGYRSFYRHEKESADLTRRLLVRLRYSNSVIDAVCHLIGEHMFHYDETWTDSAVRRFVARTGEENLPNLFALRMADTYALTAIDPPPNFLGPLKARIDETLRDRKALSLKDLAVSGRDLMAAGIPPGKHMGIILSELLEAVLDDPGLNSRERLLEIAGNINQRYSIN
jgi:putative nucleotidyltransferase with HDIG domain